MLDALFSPYTLKGKTIKNRCTVPAMVTNYCTKDGEATEKFIAYHEARAKGGWGLIITEDYAVDPLGKGFSYVAGLWNDKQIEGHKELPKRVHAYGSTILAQIYHCGRQTNEGVIGTNPVAPSAIQCPFSPNMSRELTIDEIKKIITQFGDTAYRAKQCGFDGVEIHGAHGYLIAQFMSPYTNKRVDCYGGTLENRVKFALEIVKDVRQKCGEDFIIGFRISTDEFIEGGRTLEESKVVVSMLEMAGVDLIHASAGVYASADTIIASSYIGHAWLADYAAEIKKSCNIPVIAVGRITEPKIANSLIKSGKADFAGMARASLVDSKLPNKAKDSNFEDIRQCIGCNMGCIGVLFTDNPIKCTINPELGKEVNGPIKLSKPPKNIAIVGAGPAGMQAGITAAKAGHNVTIFEKESRAGGQFYLASIPPCKGEISAFINWQVTQLDKLGVEIKYNTNISAKDLANGNYDKIIIATGGKSVKPNINGANLPHVVTIEDVLLGKTMVGANVVVIGGGSAGAEVANHLAVHLKSVTLVEMGGVIAPTEALAPRWNLLSSLEKRKVQIKVNTTVEEIKENSVVIKTGDCISEIPADNVVLAVGVEPVSLDVPNAIIIGDAEKVGNALTAIEKGHEVALAL